MTAPLRRRRRAPRRDQAGRARSRRRRPPRRGPGARTRRSTATPPSARPRESADPYRRPYWDLAKLDPRGRVVLWRLLPTWDGGAVEIAGTVEEGDEVAGFRVIELPGHAPGLIGLFRESDRLALVSDCFYTLDPQTGIKGSPRASPTRRSTIDTEQARGVDPQARRARARGGVGRATPTRSPATSSRSCERAAADARRRSVGQPRPPSARSSPRRAREYRDADGNVLVLRGSLTPGSRRQYAETLAGGLDREDAWQRATELLFERLAVSWTISGLEITRQKELLGRYRMASADERRFVRDALRDARRRALPGAPGAVIDPDAFAALAVRLVPRGRTSASRCWSSRRRSPQPLVRALHRALLERGAWPLAAARRPRSWPRTSTARARRACSTRSRRWSWPRWRTADALPADRRARRTRAALAGDRPGA